MYSLARFALTLVATALALGACAPAATPHLRLATTTSLYDTGLWDYLEPMFEAEYGVELDVMYAGTGKALEWARRGDVDIIVTHSRERELQLVADGYGLERVPFAYNYFLIVGPADDPAGIRGLPPEDAFRRIAASRATFVSRGDDSGTHSREKAIWAAAGLDYEQVRRGGARYIEAGSGMGPTLVMASEKRAYTLTDTGTFLAYRGKLGLVPLVESGTTLLNVYSAIVVNPGKVNVKNADRARDLVRFLTSAEVQDLIGSYGVAEYGQALFSPCAGAEPRS